MQACNNCPSYKKGRGTEACIKCPEIKQLNILQRAQPCVDYVKIPREILEALSEQNNIDIYSPLSIDESILIFMIYTLNLTQREIANYLKISLAMVNKKKKSSLLKLRTYILKSQI